MRICTIRKIIGVCQFKFIIVLVVKITKFSPGEASTCKNVFIAAYLIDVMTFNEFNHMTFISKYFE